MMTPELERELTMAAQRGDVRARDELVANMTPYITKICYGVLRGRPIEMEDAVQNAIYEALRAIDTFDPDKSRLSTYLSLRIAGACKDYVRNLLPPGCRRKKFYHNMRTSRSIYHLSTEEKEWVESIEDDEAEIAFCESDGRDLIREFAARFNPPLSDLILRRYLNGHTLRRIGSGIGLSESRCSQMETQLISRVRDMHAEGTIDLISGRFKAKGHADMTYDRTQPQTQPPNNAHQPAPPATTGTASLVDAALSIVRAKAGDLAELDSKIEDAEQVLVALKTFRKILRQRLNVGEGDEKPAALRGKVGLRIEEYLRSHPSPTVAELKSDLELTGQGWSMALRKSKGRFAVGADDRVTLKSQ